MQTDLATVGRALAAPARAAMIDVLMDGQEHSAGALAEAAGVSASTASSHLTVLRDAGLVEVDKRGRTSWHRLAGEAIAHALEALGGPVDEPVTSLRLSREKRRVQAARTCYDHLAGRLGVALLDRMIDLAWVSPDVASLTPAGRAGLHERGVDLSTRLAGRRPVARPCLDWTERRHHLAGAAAAALCDRALEDGWVERRTGSRGLTVTAHGRRVLGNRWGVVLDG